jgi:hypothetical protein
VHQDELTLGLGLIAPLLRPSVLLSSGRKMPPWTLSTQLAVSYASLQSEFRSAVASSRFSEKLSASTASLLDVHLALPELRLALNDFLYVSLSPFVRASRVNSAFTTTASEALSFDGWGFAAGIAAGGGIRTFISPTFGIDLFSQINVPLQTFGWSDVAFERDNSRATPTFSEADVEEVADSLQPYLQARSKEKNAWFGIGFVFAL